MNFANIEEIIYRHLTTYEILNINVLVDQNPLNIFLSNFILNCNYSAPVILIK